ncbi:MAG: folate-binding protein [Alphaproteobacteria bacterium]|nr:folate-binding protein [Alphaproteobacteria bacterium]
MSEKTAVRLAGRGLLAIEGEDTRTFLQGLITNDIHKVSAARSIYAALLTAQGKFLHDFFVGRLTVDDKEVIAIEAERARLPDLLRRLTLYKLRAKIALSDISERFAVWALFGTQTLAALELPVEAGRATAWQGGVVSVDPRHASLGARAWVPAANAEAVLKAAGFSLDDEAAYDRHRLALAVPDGSRDIAVDKNLPLECGFDELNAIDYQKGCYVGQEMTARTHYRATIRKRLYRVDLDGPEPAQGTPILCGDSEAGEMRSARDGVGIALLRVEEVDAAMRDQRPLTAGATRLRPVKPAWANF